MVILQFNKLIRNKWVWGAFAVVISAAFCFDDLFTTREREERSGGTAGSLAGEVVKAGDFATVADDMRGLGRNRDWRRKTSEVNRLAWETLAGIAVARRDGIEATDAEVREMIRNDRSFAVNGQFSFALYQRVLRENAVTPERFEDFLKRRLTMSRVAEVMLECAAWVSPMEIDRAVADMTDTLTVRVARFTQSAEDAAAVNLDDDGLRKWYDENVSTLALPERVKLRMVKFDATKEDVLAKMSVSEDDMRDYYDTSIDKYTSTDTNGVEVVKSFDEVKGEIEPELRRIAAVQFFETNLNQRAYAGVADASVSRLDAIAGEDGIEVTVSDWFTTDGSYVDGFMRPASTICPGARGFTEIVAELDSSTEDLRYGVVSSDKAVWLVEKAEVSPAHTPAFEEAKDVIRPKALRAAQGDAFKAAVEAVAAQGVEAVLASGDVSTNLTFAVCDLKPGDFTDQGSIASAASKLSKGDVSGFVRTGSNTALLVVCDDRVPGDAAKATLLTSQVRDEVSRLQAGQLPESWRKWNLDRLGFETTDVSAVDETVEEEE